MPQAPTGLATAQATRPLAPSTCSTIVFPRQASACEEARPERSVLRKRGATLSRGRDVREDRRGLEQLDLLMLAEDVL